MCFRHRSWGLAVEVQIQKGQQGTYSYSALTLHSSHVFKTSNLVPVRFQGFMPVLFLYRRRLGLYSHPVGTARIHERRKA